MSEETGQVVVVRGLGEREGLGKTVAEGGRQQNLDVSEIAAELLGHVGTELGGRGFLLTVTYRLVPAHIKMTVDDNTRTVVDLSLMSSILSPIQGNLPPFMK